MMQPVKVKRVKVDPSEIVVNSHTTDGGLILWTARSRWQVLPLGVVWVQLFEDRAAYVIWSYTLPYFRRSGVRTAIHRAMAKRYHTIMTGAGTVDGGTQFLRRAGFKWDAIRGVWVWAAPDAKRIPRPRPIKIAG